jgi:hypothetical protein
VAKRNFKTKLPQLPCKYFKTAFAVSLKPNCIKMINFTPVKWLNIILSIYLVILTSIPCADMEVNSAGHSMEAHQADRDNHSHDKDNDLCSPFCICNCCGAQILSYSPTISFELPLISQEIKTKEPVYKSVFASDFFGSIWQPPQLA